MSDEREPKPIPFDEALRRLVNTPHKKQERGKRKTAKDQPEKKTEPPK